MIVLTAFILESYLALPNFYQALRCVQDWLDQEIDAQGESHLVRASALDMARLLAAIADSLSRCLRGAIARQVTDFTTYFGIS